MLHAVETDFSKKNTLNSGGADQIFWLQDYIVYSGTVIFEFQIFVSENISH